MAGHAPVCNTNWYNSHNSYGELKDIQAATLEDVRTFFSTYYAPNNAELAVVGDFQEKEARDRIQKYFAAIPASRRPTAPQISAVKAARLRGYADRGGETTTSSFRASQ